MGFAIAGFGLIIAIALLFSANMIAEALRFQATSIARLAVTELYSFTPNLPGYKLVQFKTQELQKDKHSNFFTIPNLGPGWVILKIEATSRESMLISTGYYMKE